MKTDKKSQKGFTVAEVLISVVVFGIMAVGMAQAFIVVDTLYARTRQLYELYTVLSACPEIDRALQYEQVVGSVNCFPNNVFDVEGGSSGTIAYTPTLSVNETSSLPMSDALSAVPGSKVVTVEVDYINSTSLPYKIRLLISRNGIGQL